MLEKLDTQHCTKAYTQTFISSRSNVILMSNQHIAQESKSTDISMDYINNEQINRGDIGQGITTYDWICQGGPIYCTEVTRISPDNWHPYNDTQVSYWLSKRTSEQCKLHFSLPITITMIIFNLAKLGVFLSMFYRTSHQPLLTIGDALVSFLQRSDRATSRFIIFDRSDFEHFWYSRCGAYMMLQRRWYKSIEGAQLVFYSTMQVARDLIFDDTYTPQYYIPLIHEQNSAQYRPQISMRPQCTHPLENWFQ